MSWYGNDLCTPLWDNPETRSLTFLLAAVEEDESDLYIMMNMSTDRVKIQLPQLQGRKWHLAVDTSRLPPKDIVAPEKRKPVHKNSYSVHARTVVVLEGSRANN